MYTNLKSITTQDGKNPYEELRDVNFIWIDLKEICAIVNNWTIFRYPSDYFLIPILNKCFVKKLSLHPPSQKNQLHSLLREEEKIIALWTYYKVCMSWFFSLKSATCISSLKNLDNNNFLWIASVDAYRDFIIGELREKANNEQKLRLQREFPERVRMLWLEVKVVTSAGNIREILERNFWDVSGASQALFKELSEQRISALSENQQRKYIDDLILLEKANFDIVDRKKLVLLFLSTCISRWADLTWKTNYSFDGLVQTYNITLDDLGMQYAMLESKHETFVLLILNVFSQAKRLSYENWKNILSKLFDYYYGKGNFKLCNKIRNVGSLPMSKEKITTITSLGDQVYWTSAACVKKLVSDSKRKMALMYARSLWDTDDNIYLVFEYLLKQPHTDEEYVQIYNELLLDRDKIIGLRRHLDDCIEKIVYPMLQFTNTGFPPRLQESKSYISNHSIWNDLIAKIVNGQLDKLKDFVFRSSKQNALSCWNLYLNHMVGDIRNRQTLFLRGMWAMYEDNLTLWSYFRTVLGSLLNELQEAFRETKINTKNVLVLMKPWIQASTEQQFVLYALLNEVDKEYRSLMNTCFEEKLNSSDYTAILQILGTDKAKSEITWIDAWVIKVFEKSLAEADLSYALYLIGQYDFLRDKKEDVQYAMDVSIINGLWKKHGFNPESIHRTSKMLEFMRNKIKNWFDIKGVPAYYTILEYLYKNRIKLKISQVFVIELVTTLKQYLQALLPDSRDQQLYFNIIENYFGDSEEYINEAEAMYDKYTSSRSNKIKKQYEKDGWKLWYEVDLDNYQSAGNICDTMMARLEKNRLLKSKYLIIWEQKKQNLYGLMLWSKLSKSSSLFSNIQIASLTDDKRVELRSGNNKRVELLRSEYRDMYTYCKQHGLSQWHFVSLFKQWYGFAHYIDDQSLIAELGDYITIHGIALPKERRWSDFEAKNTQTKKDSLASLLSDPHNLKVEQLQDLIAFFGMESSADILYSLFPGYESLWATAVKSIISEYLGEFLIKRYAILFQQIPENLDLWNMGFITSLQTIIEKDFLRKYVDRKKTNVADEVICKEYVIGLKSGFVEMAQKNPKIQGALVQVADGFDVFLQWVLKIKKPDNFVDELHSGREFPDFLQKINAAEVANKRRFLIADGMGMGKSLSAILAMENIGKETKPCLILTPKNVVETRNGYLSEQSMKWWKNVWYFKKGKKPRVLVVETWDDLWSISWWNYDYVVMSQELMNNKNTAELLKTSFWSMIVDEIHKLKNTTWWVRSEQLMKLSKKIEEKNGYLCLLSGTPIPNKVKDIAVLLKLLYPIEYSDQSDKSLVDSIMKWDTLQLRTMLLPRMQMKKLTDHIEMPPFIEEVKRIKLSADERIYYDSILQDDQLTAAQKIPLLRKFILNPSLLWIEDLECSKASQIWKDSNELFTKKKRIVYFINGPISWTIRPDEKNWITQENTFISKMWLAKWIKVQVIHGDISDSERKKIQDRFNDESSDEKIALFVSGSTADVGIDLTGGEHIIHINEPWTQADKDQQDARVYRYGQSKPITSTTYIVDDSIEEGINKYLKLKNDAILKLYFGIELTETERKALVKDDGDVPDDGEAGSVNKWLADYFKTSSRELNEMFGCLKQAWSGKAEELVQRRWEEFAGYYKDLGPRSYQANVNRIAGQIIKNISWKGKIDNPVIVDLWSGPKMLRRHIDDKLKNDVISVDINPHHFSPEDIESGKAVVSNFLNISSHIPEKSVDFISCSLSFQDTSWEFDNEEPNLERLQLLLQMHKVLKIGWTAMVSLPYSLMIKNMYEFENILKKYWFELVKEYTGNVSSDSQCNVNLISIRKTRNLYNWDYERPNVKKWDFDGLTLVKKKGVSISNQKKVVSSFDLHNESFEVEQNKEGRAVVNSEKICEDLIKRLKDKYQRKGKKSIQFIPKEELLSNWFGRYFNSWSCVLIKKLHGGYGLFTHRESFSEEKN